MLVHGYTANKTIERVELPVERIVAEGIDPWRLDLFDEAPLSSNVDGKQLFFRRLRDVCFSYGQKSVLWSEAVERGWPHWYCVHDDENITCIESRLRTVDGRHIQHIEISREPFSHHLTTYLSHPIETLPRVAKALQVQGDRVSIDMEVRPFIGRPLAFTGTMQEERTSFVQLPEAINNVFKAVKSGNPIVSGPALRNALVNRPFDAFGIDVVVEADAWTTIVAELPEGCCVDQDQLTVTIDGVRCVFHLKIAGGSKSQVARACGWLYSVDRFQASAENTITGSRISFFDLGRLQTRKLDFGTSRPPEKLPSAAGLFGFNVLPHPEEEE